MFKGFHYHLNFLLNPRKLMGWVWDAPMDGVGERSSLSCFTTCAVDKPMILHLSWCVLQAS